MSALENTIERDEDAGFDTASVNHIMEDEVDTDEAASCSLFDGIVVLIPQLLIATAWVYIQFSRTPFVNEMYIIMDSFDIILLLISVVSIGLSFVKSPPFGHARLDVPTAQYSLLKHCRSETVDNKLKRCTLLTIVLLALCYVIFLGVQTSVSVQCLANEMRYVFDFIRNISKIVFVIAQTTFIIVSMTRWRYQSPIELGKILTVVLTTDVAMITRFCMKAHMDFNVKNISPFPLTIFCYEPDNTDICDAYDNYDATALDVNTYSYSFETVYLLFAIVTMSQFYYVDESVATPDTLSQSDDQPVLDTRLLMKIVRKLKKWFTLTLTFISRYSLFISILVSLLKFVSLVYMNESVFEHKLNVCNSTEVDFLSNAITILDTVYNYLASIVAMIAAMLTVGRYLWCAILRDPKVAILIFSASCHLIFILLETLEAFKGSDTDPVNASTLFVFVGFHYIGVISQPILIVRYFKQQLESDLNPLRSVFIRGCIVFVGVCNVEKLIEDMLLPPEIMVFLAGSRQPSFAIRHWWLIVKICYPFICFYRLFSSVMCYRAFVIQNTSRDTNLT